MGAGRLAYLDGLRGVAAAAVLIFHLNLYIGIVLPYEGAAGIPRLLLGRLTNGNFAVCIFFVLSGYVLVDRLARTGNIAELGEAAIRRYFRLTPVAFASVMLAYLMWVTIGVTTKDLLSYGPGFAWMTTVYDFQPSLTGAVYNGLIGIYARDNSYNGPLWTIEIELWGSLFLFGFMALFLKSRNLLPIAAAVSLLLIVVFKDRGIYFSLFLAGAMLRLYPSRTAGWYFAPIALYLGSFDEWSPDAAAIMTGLGLPWGTFQDTVLPHALGAILLVSIVSSSKGIQRVLSSSPIQWLGGISYSLYAIHIPVIFAVGNTVFLMLASAGYYWLGAVAAIISVVSVTLVLSELLYRFIDQPAQGLAKAIANRLFHGKPAEISSSSYSAPG